MWKSGWNLDREWVKRNEKWLILLVLGLAILILYAPFGKKTSETGVWQSGERWAESGTGTNSGNRAGQDKNGSSEESGSDVETGLPGTASRQDTNRIYELRLEQRIRDVLKKVDGVGEVDVMLTLFLLRKRCCGWIRREAGLPPRRRILRVVRGSRRMNRCGRAPCWREVRAAGTGS
ncbi:MAG: hypothetical protein ACLR3S_12225 [Clostridium fessum]